MTDAARNFVWRAIWLPFGGLQLVTGPAANDYRLPGQWFQLESGLHYNWHRHYDPSTGRYLQPDPLGMPDGPNRWAYAANSPLMNVDPEGEQWKERTALMLHLLSQEPLPGRLGTGGIRGGGNPIVRVMEPPICIIAPPGYKVRF